MSDKIESVVLIGAGNVAWHIGHSLVKNNIKIKQVISKSEASCSQLAEDLSCDYKTDLKKIDPSTDLYIISVSDKSVLEVVNSLNTDNQFVVHTSGSINMDVFEGKVINHGVLYPFQTFTKNVPVIFNKVPLCVEANSPENLEKLIDFAHNLSDIVKVINSDERSILHLSAVFACNFTNHMFYLAQKIVQDKGLDFEILKPLIKETVSKIDNLSPQDAQTGPAVRNDYNVIEKHLKMLEDIPEIRDIYSIISKSISTWHKKD